jgi:serine/threonine protein phosphatase PrpC
MKIHSAGKTDVGLKRATNEDCFGSLEDERLFIVADGMGGHAMGEVASKMAVETLKEFYVQTRADEGEASTSPHKRDGRLFYVEDRLACGVKLANWKVCETALSSPTYKGMGTTLVAALIHGDKIHFANVGDSRVYRIRGDEIQQLTRDHSLFEDYKEAYPEISEEEKRHFPHKNVITRGLGLREGIPVDIKRESILDGDMFLLCTDGLTGMLEDPKILEIVRAAAGDLEEAVTRLVEAANRNGGVDNTTVILLRCDARDSEQVGAS